MNYLEFVDAVEEKMKKEAEDCLSVFAQTNVKNNGKKRKGLTIMEKGLNVAPTIYLEEYFMQFKRGKSIDNIVGNIWELYKEVRFTDNNIGVNLMSYDKIKGKIVYKLINLEKNQEMLQDVPYRKFLDLALVCYVLLDNDEHGTATMTVKWEHLKSWGIDKDTLFRNAERNTRRLLPAEVKTMKDTISELLGKEEDGEEDGMYVVTNPLKCFGAVCICYVGVLYMIGEVIGEDYFIIPSSVHEMILVAKSYAVDREELEEMVREINETQVDEEEVLSNKVYYYDRKTRKII